MKKWQIQRNGGMKKGKAAQRAKKGMHKPNRRSGLLGSGRNYWILPLREALEHQNQVESNILKLGGTVLAEFQK